MRVQFIGTQLSFMNNDGDKVRITNGATLTVGEDLPEAVFGQFAHRFKLMDAAPEIPKPEARVMTAAAPITHTGGGWYIVQGHTGKYRKAEAERIAQGES